MNSFIETLNSLDQEMILFLNSLGTPFWDGFWLLITDRWTAIPLYGWLCWLCYKQHSLRRFLC
ncbi:MAG: phosphatase PAP2 family protein, partial [Capnocytophaga sp.]|nr:phosphatase PAP2 family protein [Capnocytophaga sp.]